MSANLLPTKFRGTEELRGVFARDGFLPPFALFTRAQCDLAMGHIFYGDRPAPSKWVKGHAVTDTLIFDLATRPALLERRRLLLGDDVVLWGARVREPKQVHHWHSDIESCSPRVVSLPFV